MDEFMVLVLTAISWFIAIFACVIVIMVLCALYGYLREKTTLFQVLEEYIERKED